MDKKSFILYKDWQPLICSMTDEQAGVLFKAIYEYQSGNDVEMTDALLQGVFDMIKNRLDADFANYQEICERRKAYGKMGGLAKASKSQAKASKSKHKLEKAEPIKHKYGPYKNVLLTDEELEKWKTEHPNDWEKWIDELSNGIASKGYKYKDFLATLRNWAKREGVNNGNAGATISNATSNQRKEYDEINRIIGW